MRVEERACGNSWSQLKKKLNFQLCSRKTRVEFPWVFGFELGTREGFRKLHPQPPPLFVFFLE